MSELSVLIPSRNEMFLARTIQDILDHSEANTEIIAVLDGVWANPPIPDHPRVTLIYHPVSIGQRAATNEAARLSRSKYVMKVDAHCSLAQGFDTVLLGHIQDNQTIVPIMRNLHAFNWTCPQGHWRYQGPSGPCLECGEPTHMEMAWIAKPNPQSKSYTFDPSPHFQYFKDFSKRSEGQGDLTPTMSLQGSCFMMTKERYLALNICDETWGSWGSQGIEVAVKTWLSGGEVVVDHQTYYAHMFRTQGGDFGFPYPLPGRQIEYAKNKARELFFNNVWDRAIYPLSWLVEKFWPITHTEKNVIYHYWTDKDLEQLKACESKDQVS